ncbi:MAG: hypothetical protein Q9220_006083 [cf. Caloplaca sp. 1 TL-2023]
MGICTSTPVTKAEKKGYYGPPPERVASAETQLNALLKGTGTPRATARTPVPKNVKTGSGAPWMSGGLGEGDHPAR